MLLSDIPWKSPVAAVRVVCVNQNPLKPVDQKHTQTQTQGTESAESRKDNNNNNNHDVNKPKFIANPSEEECRSSEVNIIVAATYDRIVMIEGECSEVSPELFVSAVEFGCEQVGGHFFLLILTNDVRARCILLCLFVCVCVCCDNLLGTLCYY